MIELGDLLVHVPVEHRRDPRQRSLADDRRSLRLPSSNFLPRPPPGNSSNQPAAGYLNIVGRALRLSVDLRLQPAEAAAWLEDHLPGRRELRQRMAINGGRPVPPDRPRKHRSMNLDLEMCLLFARLKLHRR